MVDNVLISSGSREQVINYIKEQKSKGPFKVIDIGGSVEGWSSPYIDGLIDFNIPEHLPDHIKHYQCDITHPNSWEPILKDISVNGKYDFCICTHTLEDIMNPNYVCEKMSEIAKSGYIAVPSKYRELSRFEHTGYRGYIHHRWILTVYKNNVVAFPKINYLDSVKIFDKVADMSDNKADLSFTWVNEIKLNYINNNYLGPSVGHVVQYYNQLCNPEFI